MNGRIKCLLLYKNNHFVVVTTSFVLSVERYFILRTLELKKHQKFKAYCSFWSSKAFFFSCSRSFSVFSACKSFSTFCSFVRLFDAISALKCSFNLHSVIFNLSSFVNSRAKRINKGRKTLLFPGNYYKLSMYLHTLELPLFFQFLFGADCIYW